MGRLTYSDYKEIARLYFQENKSGVEIASAFGISRQAVYEIIRKCGLNPRSYRESRNTALKEQRITHMSPNPNAGNYMVNESFFSRWSPEMAWVLGLLFTDGNMQARKRKNGTIHIQGFSISSKDKEIPNNISRLMSSNHKLFIGRDGLYRLSIGNRSIVNDLIKHGMTPNKSLTITFPDVPDECMSHFIRGCWDGDGSVFYDERFPKSKLRTFYVSGSKAFIVELENILHYRVGLRKRIIYARSNQKSFYIKYGHTDSIKLFNYLYRDAIKEMYLERKYNRFLGIREIAEKIDPTVGKPKQPGL